jgi:hypothetical protein
MLRPPELVQDARDASEKRLLTRDSPIVFLLAAFKKALLHEAIPCPDPDRLPLLAWTGSANGRSFQGPIVGDFPQ